MTEPAELRALLEDGGWHPDSRFVEAGGHPGHVVDTGPLGDAGSRCLPLVLIHGFVCSSWAWRYNIDALARHFRVLAPCQKGFGWSTRAAGDYSVAALAEFLLAVLDARGVARAHLCGNSMGGTVALHLARHHPDRVGDLVLVNPVAVRWRLPRLAFWAQRDWLAPVYRRAARPAVVRAGLELAAYRKLPVDRAYLDGFLGPLRRPGSMEAAVAVARGMHAEAEAIERELGAIDHRTLLVWGDRDLIVPFSRAPLVLERLRDARLVRFEGAGHCPHEDSPSRFNRVVRSFLDGSTHRARPAPLHGDRGG